MDDLRWNRRSFIKYVSAAFSATALPSVLGGCASRAASESDVGTQASADTPLSQWPTVYVRRPEDFLKLGIAYLNLQLDANGKNLVRTGAPGTPAFVALLLGAQAVWEDTRSIESSQLGGDSRLVFRVPDAVMSVPFTMGDLLDACARWDMSVSPSAVEPNDVVLSIASPLSSVGHASSGDGVSRARLDRARLAAGVKPLARAAAAAWVSPGTPPQVPTDGQTWLELPHRLILSPNRFGAWAFARQPVRSPSGRVELWHARLGVRAIDGSVDERSAFYRTVRALGTRDGGGTTDLSSGDANSPEVGYARDRGELVALTADFHDTSTYTPKPIAVDSLAVSALGGFFDGHFDIPTPPLGHSLQTWRHRMTLGRDQYDFSVNVGVTLPCGHPATLTTITRRVAHEDTKIASWDVVSSVLEIRQPRRVYDDGVSAFAPPSLPFTMIELLDHHVEGYSGGWSQPLSAVAHDRHGNPVRLELPVYFVPYDSSNVRTINDTDPHLTIALDGQRVTFATAPAPTSSDVVSKAGATTFVTTSITFKGPSGIFDQSTVVVPTVVSAVVEVSALKQMAGQASASVGVTFHDRFKTSGLDAAANPQQMLFNLAAPVAMALSGRREDTGGLVSPDMPSIEGISVKTGLVGKVASFAIAGPDTLFDPSQFVGQIGSSLAGGKLFGVFDLGAMLLKPAMKDIASLAGAMPTFIAQSYDKVERFIAELESLGHRIADAGTAVTQQGAAIVAIPGGIVVPAELTTVMTHAQDVVTALRALVTNPTSLDMTPLSVALGKLKSDLSLALAAKYAGLGVPNGPRRDIERKMSDLAQTLGDVAGYVGELASALALLRQGQELVKDQHVKVDWRPLMSPEYDLAGVASFRLLPRIASQPSTVDLRSLLLSVDARGKAIGSRPAGVDVLCSIDNFEVTLGATTEADAPLSLVFEHFHFRKEQGKKADVDLVLRDLVFGGPLKFLETIRHIVPLDGFSDPPHVDVDATGLHASFSVAFPNLAVGIFSLENIKVSAGLEVPFFGDAPVHFSFAFCDKTHPFLLTVAFLGGGGYLELEATTKGLERVDAALEFGAHVAVDLGVASGSASVMAGIYFEYVLAENRLTLGGFLRMRGELEVLGLITVSVELYLGLHYDGCHVVGEATLEIEVDVGFFSQSVSLHTQKTFAGSNDDPVFTDVMPTLSVWSDYCLAFQPYAA